MQIKKFRFQIICTQEYFLYFWRNYFYSIIDNFDESFKILEIAWVKRLRILNDYFISFVRANSILVLL